MPTDKLPMAENPDFTFDAGWADVGGRSHVAFTNRGSPFRCFVPGAGTAANDQYFCHGHTFDTFRLYGYSPFSGRSVARIIQDEYQAVPNGMAGLQAGDVVTWSNLQNVIIHSSLVINVPAQPAANNISVWTKNGRSAVAVSTLTAVNTVYAPAVPAYWRAR